MGGSGLPCLNFTSEIIRPPPSPHLYIVLTQSLRWCEKWKHNEIYNVHEKLEMYLWFINCQVQHHKSSWTSNDARPDIWYSRGEWGGSWWGMHPRHIYMGKFVQFSNKFLKQYMQYRCLATIEWNLKRSKAERGIQGIEVHFCSLDLPPDVAFTPTSIVY